MTDAATTAATTTAETTAATTTAAATTSKPWYDGKADAETIGHWDNKGWKKDDPAEVAIQATKAARELQKHFGVPADQLLKLPKEDDAAGWAALHQRLGAPKEATEYDLTAVKFNGQDLEAGFADKMRGALMAANVAKDKATGIVKTVVDYLESADAAEGTERAAMLKVDRGLLEKEWGANFEFNRLTAMQGAKRLGVSEEDVAKLQDVLGYKRTMEHFFKIGAGTTEDTFHESNQGKGGNPTTQSGAVARLAELQADKEWAARLLKGGSAERKEFDNLMLMIHGAAA